MCQALTLDPGAEQDRQAVCINALADGNLPNDCLCQCHTLATCGHQLIPCPAYAGVAMGADFFGQLLARFAAVASGADAPEIEQSTRLCVLHQNSGFQVSPPAAIAGVDGIVNVQGGEGGVGGVGHKR